VEVNKPCKHDLCVNEWVPVKVRDSTVSSDTPMRSIGVVGVESYATVGAASITTSMMIRSVTLSW